MLEPLSQPERVRCRQIAEGDLNSLAGFLARGFPAASRDGWAAGLARIATLPPVEGMPQFGYVLESGMDIVGALLVISSRRGDGRIIANLSSWYVEPGWRAHSALLVALATRHKHVTYLNISPAPHTWRLMEAQGFHPFNFGRSAAFPVLGFGGGHVSQTVPDGLPERDMLLAHQCMGCVSLVCEKDGLVLPFIFKPRRLDRPPVRMMDLIYCRGADDFTRCGPALGRHLLKRGALGVVLDGRISGMPSHYVAGKEPRYYKGPAEPALNDLAFTEKVIFT